MARVLVVEDNDLVRRAMTLVLSLADHAVLHAGDGEAALAAIEADTPEIVLTDLGLPGMGGIAFIRAAKTRWPALPVVAMSGGGLARDGADLLDAAAAAGADLVLRKPFDDQVLLDSIARHLGGGP